MAKRCDICGRGNLFGASVSHAHNVTKRRWQPNLQRVRVIIDGVPKRLYVCTRCLRSDAVQKGIRAARKAPPRKKTEQT
jgi:large subunit ribosomal protein L28